MSTKRIKERFIENNHGFWKANCLLLIIFFIALTTDGLSTIHFMMNDGIETEMHPAINIAARIAGPVVGPLLGVVGKAIAGVIVAIYWRRIAWIILLVVSIISFWAAWFNLWGWQYYTPSIIKYWPL